VNSNTGASSRTGSLRVAGQTVTVYQEAGATCTYILNPTQQDITAAGGPGSVGVSAATGCPWTASSDVAWITVTAGLSGSGNGTVVYSVAANSSTSSRTGTLTVAGNTLKVIQAASAGVPAISVSPASLKFGFVGINLYSSKKVTVTNNGNAPLDIQSVTISGNNANQFSETHACGQLAPGGSCTLMVTFSPTTTGTKSAALQIYSNDPARNPVSVPLSGKTARR